jgi:pimeloyl-ACP methyl ester carboxylesterase
MRTLGGLLLSVGLFAVACSSSQTETTQKGESSDNATSVASSTTAPSSVAPTLAPGEITTGSVEVDGVAIDYVVSVPEGFESGDEAPLLLAFPAGAQGLDLTRSLVETTYAPEAERLGWVVVSPAAPNGELYFQGSELLVPGFLDWVETWVTPEGGAPHVAGISNGGISTFRFAALNPDRVLSLTTFPGFPRSEDDQAALSQLATIPVRLYVGGNDTVWIGPAEQAANTLESLGADVELTVFAGEGHVMASTRDGTLVFEQLETFR